MQASPRSGMARERTRTNAFQKRAEDPFEADQASGGALPCQLKETATTALEGACSYRSTAMAIGRGSEGAKVGAGAAPPCRTIWHSGQGDDPSRPPCFGESSSSKVDASEPAPASTS